MSGLQVLSYLSILFSLVVVISKMIRIARMPVHLRWDLYPIPHEKGKGKYGGSYFEEVDWWTKPKHFSLASELKAMAKEIIFVHSVYEHNRPLWVFSFPFHLGLYCLIGFVVLLTFGAILGAAGIEVSAASSSGVAAAAYHITVIIGSVGWILSIVGAFGLLLSRLSNEELRASTVLSDYVNLLFLLAVFSAGFVSWVSVDPAYAVLRGYVESTITFSTAGPLPAAVSVQLWLVVALLLYFPFTHMTHVFAKYFTYHVVRWADKPNIHGSKIEKAVSKSLGYRIDWSAPHIKSGGTWAEAATTNDENNKDGQE